MKTVDTSTKIKCLVEMALKGEMTWHNLDSLIDGLALNLESSRQINRILLKELENHQSICFIKLREDQLTSLEDKLIEGRNYEELGIETIEERQAPAELLKIRSEKRICVDNSQRESQAKDNFECDICGKGFRYKKKNGYTCKDSQR